MHGEGRGQSLGLERIELCNDGKCQLRARKGGRRWEKSRTVNKRQSLRCQNEMIPDDSITGITATVELFSLISRVIMSDGRNGSPPLNPVQHPDLRGDLRLFPHRVGHAP